MTTRRKSLWLAALGMALTVVFPGPLPAKVYIDINNPGGRKLPIAIPDFVNLGTQAGPSGLARELSEVIAQDVRFSGFFEVLNPATFIEDPARRALTRDQIHFQDWTVIGAEALVKGSFVVTPEGFHVTARLFDAVQGRMIVGKRYEGTAKDARLIAHRFANEVFRAFTGEPGVFDTRIAYVSTATGSREIHVTDYDGHRGVFLTRHRSITLGPRWSPDWRFIAYTSYGRRNPDAYTVDVQRHQSWRLSGYRGLNTGATWSPAGDRIAIALSKDGNAELYIMDPKGNVLRRLTRNRAIDISPTWSPDGRRIAFVSDRGGSPQIYVMDADGGEARRLTFQGGYNSSPAWSPRGDKIAFASRQGGAFDILLINLDGTSLQRLTHGNGSNENPSWSPDGRYLAFSSTRGGRAQIYIMTINGTNQTRITRKGANTMPSWSPWPR